MKNSMGHRKMSIIVSRFYQAWLNGDKLFENYHDIQRFYKFVKACMKYCKSPKPNGQWLRHYLKKDLLEKFHDNELAEEYTQKAVSLFDHLRDYHLTNLPYIFKSELDN